MDFTFSDDQLALGRVARQLFERRATTDRLAELEAAGTRDDPALWQELATADLVGIALPGSVGGSRNAVSLRLSQRVIACICSVFSPSAAATTPSGLPVYGPEPNTSTS